jgi:hypothetical protein
VPCWLYVDLWVFGSVIYADDATGLPSGDSRFFSRGKQMSNDATGLPSGVSRSSQEREPPPGKPVASRVTSPMLARKKRESPPDKPVAS